MSSLNRTDKLYKGCPNLTMENRALKLTAAREASNYVSPVYIHVPYSESYNSGSNGINRIFTAAPPRISNTMHRAVRCRRIWPT